VWKYAHILNQNNENFSAGIPTRHWILQSRYKSSKHKNSETEEINWNKGGLNS
jgi:hypothetical protein